jgi:peptidoglycan/xylan/chitin deacetylase (PgdA/CDA1 family)
MYHQISETPLPAYAKYSQSLAQFARQMRWLAARGYTTLSLDSLLRCRLGAESWPRRPVAITIDDGYDDAVRAALEVLPKHGFTATVFVVTGAVGGRSGWDAGVELPVAGWDLLRELGQSGIQCGSHTVTHRRLTELDADACRRELEDAKRGIEDRLGVTVRHLSYPFGAVSPEVRRLAEAAGYQTGCAVTIGLSTDDDDPLMLRRVRILGTDRFADFVFRLRSGRTVADAARRKLGRIIGRKPSG